MTSRTGSVRAEGFGRFWKRKLVEMRPASREDGWLSFARGGFGLVSHEMGGRWKSQYRKIVSLSPYVEKPLNSKVIKSFVPEQRNRKCFLCFKIPMFSVIYIWTLYVHFTHGHIWLWYITLNNVFCVEFINIVEKLTFMAPSWLVLIFQWKVMK